MKNKEEQKQHLIDMMESDEELGMYEEPKQETLEEAVKNYCIKKYSVWVSNSDKSDDFINGAKWMQERSYSDEEIKLEEVFNDDKKENIKKFIDEIINPSQPNQALKDAAERLKGRELFKESNDRARKILSEIKYENNDARRGRARAQG